MSVSAPRTRSILEHLASLRDPREGWRVLYPLWEIPLVVSCATLCGMDDFVEIKFWGEAQLDLLRRFLPFERGIPSHDALHDVMNGIDPEPFKSCFTEWVETLLHGQPDIIAIDGKTSRRCHDRARGREPLHLVSARGARQRLVLEQEANRPATHDDVARFFADPPPGLVQSAHTTTDGDHGRLEERRHSVCHDVSWMRSNRRCPDEPCFPGLAMIGMVETRVERGGKIEAEKRCHLSSAKLDAETFAKAVRTHWHIENRLHSTLDVAFHDDLARLRTGHGPENMAVIRRCAMNLVRQADDKHSLEARRKKANLDPAHLGKLLASAKPST